MTQFQALDVEEATICPSQPEFNGKNITSLIYKEQKSPPSQFYKAYQV